MITPRVEALPRTLKTGRSFAGAELPARRLSAASHRLHRGSGGINGAIDVLQRVCP